ncbi:MAG: 50S ribosomal protein L32 [Puniceicoccales bacterium]|jgi:large subunit ribosomal protein L32|nr:50S ribosomal protein L32 [Puniceicoccales bacterium]
MGQPKRKQSKQRSRKRRGANIFSGPELARDPTTGNLFNAHHVNPETGMYRGRQIIDTKD